MKKSVIRKIGISACVWALVAGGLLVGIPNNAQASSEKSNADLVVRRGKGVLPPGSQTGPNGKSKVAGEQNPKKNNGQDTNLGNGSENAKANPQESEKPMVNIKGSKNGNLPQTGQLFQIGTIIAGIVLIFLAALMYFNHRWIKKMKANANR